jgi:hypothetical protein
VAGLAATRRRGRAANPSEKFAVCSVYLPYDLAETSVHCHPPSLVAWNPHGGVMFRALSKG